MGLLTDEDDGPLECLFTDYGLLREDDVIPAVFEKVRVEMSHGHSPTADELYKAGVMFYHERGGYVLGEVAADA